MIECPSVTFPGVGLQGSRMGEPHAAPHIHPCAIMSGGMNDICGPVYDITCIGFKYISCIFCTLIYSWCLPMVSSTLFFIKKTFLQIKKMVSSDFLKDKWDTSCRHFVKALFSLSQRCEARPPAEQHPSGVKSGQEVKEFNSSSHFKKTARPLLTLSEHLFGMNQEKLYYSLKAVFKEIITKWYKTKHFTSQISFQHVALAQHASIHLFCSLKSPKNCNIAAHIVQFFKK